MGAQAFCLWLGIAVSFTSDSKSRADWMKRVSINKDNNDDSRADWQQWLGEIGERCTVAHARSGTILEQRDAGQRLYTWCVCKKSPSLPFPGFDEERHVAIPNTNQAYVGSPYWDQFQDSDCRMVVFRT